MGIFGKATDQGDFIILEPGIYTVELDTVETYVHEKYGDGFRWRFIVDTDEHPDAVTANGEALAITAITSTSLGPKARARTWIQTLLGRELEVGEEPDENDLIGKKCRANISVTKKDNGEFNKIESLAPLKAGGVRRQAAAAVAAAAKF